MTTVNDTMASLGLTRQATTTAKSSDTLDQAAFLRLMTAQLNAQDPLNPMDNQAFVAQMAQFSSVAGIAEMNQSLKTLTETLTGTRLGEAAGWIGRDVLVETDQAAPLADGSYAGEVALGEDATAATLAFTDANGQIVHTQELGAQGAGSIPFAWDGRGADGNAVAGPLRITVTATGANGKVATGLATWSRVTGVQSPGSGSAASLVTPLGNLSPGDAIRLS